MTSREASDVDAASSSSGVLSVLIWINPGQEPTSTVPDRTPCWKTLAKRVRLLHGQLSAG